jgi:hypothetical protein
MKIKNGINLFPIPVVGGGVATADAGAALASACTITTEIFGVNQQQLSEHLNIEKSYS